MSFEIRTTREFVASHQLRLYDGTYEPLHSHTWRVRVVVSAPELDSIGVVMDFAVLERRIDAIVGPWSEKSLNELPEFQDFNPSAELVALCIAQRLNLPSRVSLESVEVWETPTNSAVYRP